MATLTDSFDSYSDGNLNGQGSWSGSTNFKVQGTVVQGGAKAAYNTTGGATYSINKSFTSTAAGVQTVYGRSANVTGTDGTWMFNTGEGASPAISYIKITSGGQLAYFNGSTYVNIGAVSNDTWFKADIQWDAATDQARYRLNDGTWTSYANMAGTVATGMDVVRLVNNGGGTQACYWDSLADGSGGGASGPANLKSYNTNVIANIKSINTNLIANVKSLNTNT